MDEYDNLLDLYSKINTTLVIYRLIDKLCRQPDGIDYIDPFGTGKTLTSFVSIKSRLLTIPNFHRRFLGDNF